MARIALKCACSWTFFVPGTTTGHEVDCPHCGQVVPIPGRKAGQDVPQTAGEIAATKQAQQRQIKMLIGLGVFIAVVGSISIYVMTRPGPPPPPEPEAPSVRNTPPPLPVPRAVERIPEDKPTPSREPDLYSSAQIQEMRLDVQSRIWQINMTALVSEVLRYRGLTADWAQQQAHIAEHETKIRAELVELAKAGQKMALEPYLAQGDQIIAIAQRDLTPLRPEDAGHLLQSWVAAWRPGAAIEQVGVQRGDKKMTLYLFFPEDTPELQAIVRHPALAVDPAAGTETDVPALPAALLKDIQGQFDALPPGYRAYLSPTDRKRLDALLQSRRGTPEDAEWLGTFILGDSLSSFKREAGAIRAKLLELEPKLRQNVASDVIIRKNGTRVEGQIVEETPEYVKIKSRFGTAPIRREEIDKIEKGKASELEFPRRYAEAQGSPEKLTVLLAWCTEKNLRMEKEFVAYAVLTVDASNEKARAAAGLSRPAITSPATGADTGQDAARVDLVERTIDLMARDVVAKYLTFAEVVTEMQRRTETMKTALSPSPPEKLSRGLSVIGNPLTFKARGLPVATALEVGTWWTGLTTDDRRLFAKYVGLWCAYSRSLSR